jgi:predicted small metal-binding protein
MRGRELVATKRFQPFSKVAAKIWERTGFDNRRDNKMSRQIKCECGFVARGETDDEVVAQIEGHIRSDHPELAATLTHDEIASWVEVVE